MRRIAAFLAVLLAFAQTVTAAHACSVVAPVSQSRTAAVDDDRGLHAHCATNASHAGSAVDVCALHCFAIEQAGTQVDASPALVAPQAPLTVRLGDPRAIATRVIGRVSLSDARSPPLLLLFSRLLI